MIIYKLEGYTIDSVWNIKAEDPKSLNRTGYPTQKPEELLERIIKASSNKGDLVLDCFMGSGTTLAVAQKLGRKWIGCDINIGAVQTTTKRINKILEEQNKEKCKLIETEEFKGLDAFKIYNVNEYDVFKNEVEAKEIVIDIYGISKENLTYFDGRLGEDYVKIMPLNRVLNKLDIKYLLDKVRGLESVFTGKESSTKDEATYKEGVLVIASGVESSAIDYLKKENKTSVNIEIRDIQKDKQTLIFKEPTEADVKVDCTNKSLTVTITDFYSPLLMKKLELENKKAVKEEAKTKIEGFKQIIDSVAIDVDYNGELFNAEIIDLPDKKITIKGVYNYEYKNSGKLQLQ